MQALCGLQGIFDLFNCKTPGWQDSRGKEKTASYGRILKGEVNESST